MQAANVSTTFDSPSVGPAPANSQPQPLTQQFSGPVVNGSLRLTGLHVPNPRLWWPNDTQLHTMRVELLSVQGASKSEQHGYEPTSAHSTSHMPRMAGSPPHGQSPPAADTPLDAITVRFGLRTVTADGRRIRINGVSWKLLGFDRHEMHPAYGSAVPVSVQLQDLSLLDAMAAYYIRGSHYQQDSRWLDLCDERGVLMWEEP